MKNVNRLVIVSFCLLTACAPPRPAEELPVNKVMPLETRKAETATISAWNIRGGLAAKNKTKGWTATINWEQSGPSNYQIRLNGPLGSGALLIDRKGGKVSFQDGPKSDSSSSAEELLQKHTGIRLPVNSLYYWIRGLPAPGGAQSEQHDKYNHLTHLQQSGYTVDISKYTSVKGIDLPSVVRLEGNGVMVKLIIKTWGV